MTLFSGPDQIDLYYFGRGHTNGDAWVLFPASRVVAAGDIVAGKRVPIIDTNNSGSGAEYAESIAKAHSTLSKLADTFVSGHEQPMTGAEVMEYVTFLREFADAARAAKKAGTTVEAYAKGYTIPAKFKNYTVPQEATVRAAVQVFYDEMK
jgi:glyoxylase-like metal-dependent hydrolase (beta-lactamase superfamily II)